MTSRRSRSITLIVAAPPAAGSEASSPVAQATQTTSRRRLPRHAARGRTRGAPRRDRPAGGIEGGQRPAAAQRHVDAARAVLREAARLVARLQGDRELARLRREIDDVDEVAIGIGRDRLAAVAGDEERAPEMAGGGAPQVTGVPKSGTGACGGQPAARGPASSVDRRALPATDASVRDPAVGDSVVAGARRAWSRSPSAPTTAPPSESGRQAFMRHDRRLPDDFPELDAVPDAGAWLRPEPHFSGRLACRFGGPSPMPSVPASGPRFVQGRGQSPAAGKAR